MTIVLFKREDPNQKDHHGFYIIGFPHEPDEMWKQEQPEADPKKKKKKWLFC
jgi:hypothetical protein